MERLWFKNKGKYENDKQLTYQNTPGEWWKVHHGLRNPKVSKNIINEGFIENDLNHPGQSSRQGTYFTPMKKEMEQLLITKIILLHLCVKLIQKKK